MWIRTFYTICGLATTVAAARPRGLSTAAAMADPSNEVTGEVVKNSPTAVTAAAAALRILPLGASVTFGVGSTTGNSYRLDLRNLILAASGNNTNSSTDSIVDMVGSVSNGNFDDNQCEAYSGYVLEQLAAKAASAVPRLAPDVVLVDMGTNNCNGGGTLAGFGDEVGQLVDDLFEWTGGEATVVLATVYENPDREQDACRISVNAQYGELAARYAEAGAKFVLVDMRDGGPTARDLADGRHPNDEGYRKMAQVWFRGIEVAIEKRFITLPEVA